MSTTVTDTDVTTALTALPSTEQCGYTPGPTTRTWIPAVVTTCGTCGHRITWDGCTVDDPHAPDARVVIAVTHDLVVCRMCQRGLLSLPGIPLYGNAAFGLSAQLGDVADICEDTGLDPATRAIAVVASDDTRIAVDCHSRIHTIDALGVETHRDPDTTNATDRALHRLGEVLNNHARQIQPLTG